MVVVRISQRFPSHSSISLKASSTPHKSRVNRTLVPEKSIPIHTLPPELLQQIASYLSRHSQASFSLTSRYICHSIGRESLYSYLNSAPSTKSDKRRNIEILERAFPRYWFCVWCDKFHAREAEGRGGPRRFYEEKERACQEKSGFLHVNKEYVLCWHHVRLAVNREMWGDEYGIPLSDLSYRKEQSVRLWRTTNFTNLHVEANVKEGRLIVHARFAIVMPHLRTTAEVLVPKLCKILPQIVMGHRNDEDGHTGLKTSIMQALKYPGTQKGTLCSTCATDYISSTQTTATGDIELSISVWRDLSNGRSPFEPAWRAHTEIGYAKPGFGADILRLAILVPGNIRKAFEGQANGAAGRREAESLGEGGLRYSLERYKSSLDPRLDRNWTQGVVLSNPEH